MGTHTHTHTHNTLHTTHYTLHTTHHTVFWSFLISGSSYRSETWYTGSSKYEPSSEHNLTSKKSITVFEIKALKVATQAVKNSNFVIFRLLKPFKKLKWSTCGKILYCNV